MARFYVRIKPRVDLLHAMSNNMSQMLGHCFLVTNNCCIDVIDFDAEAITDGPSCVTSSLRQHVSP